MIARIWPLGRFGKKGVYPPPIKSTLHPALSGTTEDGLITRKVGRRFTGRGLRERERLEGILLRSKIPPPRVPPSGKRYGGTRRRVGPAHGTAPKRRTIPTRVGKT